MLTYILSLTVLCGTLIVLRAMFKNKVPARLTYAIWLAVVLRLCIPFDFIQVDMPVGAWGIDSVAQDLDSFISDTVDVSGGEEDAPIQNTLTSPERGDVNTNVSGNTSENAGGSVSGLMPDSAVGNVNGGGAASGKPQDTLNGTVSDDNGVVGGVNTAVPDVQSGADGEGTDRSMAEAVLRILGAVWIVGAVVTLCAFAVSYAAFAVKLRGHREYFGKAGKTRVYVSDKVVSPCVSGIVPAIYITPEAARSESLPIILLHEKTHMAHGDHLWNLVRVAAVALHWWNPLLWAAAILSKRDAELACDESVAKKLDSRNRIEYAKMIVAMTPVKKNYAVGFGNGPIKERVLRLTGTQTTKLIAVLLSVVIVVSCAVLTFVSAKEESPEDGVLTVSPAEDFEVAPSTRGGVAIKKYVGERTEVVIPAEINGEAVKEISASAFERNTDVVSVSLPSSIRSIGTEAFKGCTSLEKVEMSEGLNRLESYAFEGCTALKRVKIPSSIGVWETGVFKKSGLEKVTIEEGVGIIGESAFHGTSLKKVSLPSSVVTVEDMAFAYCERLETVQLNEGLQNLYGAVFTHSTSLREVTIPSTVEYVGEIVFKGCESLEKVIFAGDAPESGYWYREIEGVDYESLRSECPDYTVYYKAGAKGFTYPVWEGYASCEIGAEQVDSLKIEDEIARLLDMTPAQLTSEYGEMTLEYSEYGPGQPVYSLENLDGVMLVYANHPMIEDLPESKLPYEVIVTGRYKNSICGLVCGLDLANARVGFDWTDAWIESMDQIGRYARANVGEHYMTVVMELGAVLDYEGYTESWRREFIRDPSGVITSLRIGKQAVAPNSGNGEENADDTVKVPAEFEGLPQYTVELDKYQGSSSLYIEMGNLIANEEFDKSEHKLVTVNGLSAPVYIEMGAGSNMISVSAYGHKSGMGPTVNGASLFGNVNTQLYEHDGFIILSRDYYHVGDTWAFSAEGVSELHPEDGTSLTLYYDEDGTLMYRKNADKFNADVEQRFSAPLELALSRSEFMYEVGRVSLMNGALSIYEAEAIYSISDAYDLDGIFAEVKNEEWFKAKYPGCRSADDVIATNAGTFVPEPEEEYPESLNVPTADDLVVMTRLPGNATGQTSLVGNGLAITVSDNTRSDDFMTYVITPYEDVPSGAFTVYTVGADGRETQGIYQAFGDVGVGPDCPCVLVGLEEDIVGKMGVYYSINGVTEFYRIVENADGDAVLEHQVW